jgi:hypothetical protein
MLCHLFYLIQPPRLVGKEKEEHVYIKSRTMVLGLKTGAWLNSVRDARIGTT